MPNPHGKTSQEIHNVSFDETYGQQAVEILVENAGGTALVRQKPIATEAKQDDIITAISGISGTTTYNEAYGKGVLSTGYYYWGYQISSGTAWRIKRLNATTNALEWASGASGLSTAWTAKESQSYSSTL